VKKSVSVILINILIIISLSCKTEQSSQAENGDEILIRVNPTIELFSLIYRLAGVPQYTELLLPGYISEVENYFDPFREHAAIRFARDHYVLSDINGSAPMALAIYIGDPPELQPRIDLSPTPHELDPRWNPDLINDFLEQARKFAIDSRFMEFYDEKQELHKQAEENLGSMLKKEKFTHWYKDFFGYNPREYIMNICLLNGSCSYGFPINMPDGNKEFHSLLGARWPDRNGAPQYPKDWYLQLIIHEYCHSYINPIIKGMPQTFRETGEALLVTNRVKMIEQGYNVWNVVVQEYIVRACTILFMEEYEGRRSARDKTNYDMEEGFPATEGLVDLMRDYRDNRELYPDIESFLPQINLYFQQYLLSQ